MLKEKLQPFIDRFEEITALLTAPEILNDIKKMTQLSKEQSDLLPLVEASKEYFQVLENIQENKEMLGDPELGDLAKEELKEIIQKMKDTNEVK